MQQITTKNSILTNFDIIRPDVFNIFDIVRQNTTHATPLDMVLYETSCDKIRRINTTLYDNIRQMQHHSTLLDMLR
jgi:hypothetical protein